MRAVPTEIDGLLIIEPDVFGDDRGFFLESWSRRNYKTIGIDLDFAQDNLSRSVRNVVRGLHFQTRPGQAKLVRCVRGRIWDVGVDIRKGSPTLGKWVGVELSEENKRSLFLPVGFAHGFAALGEVNDVLYKCSSPFDAATETGILWNDPDIGIDWPVKEPILSKRDISNKSLREYVRTLEG